LKKYWVLLIQQNKNLPFMDVEGMENESIVSSGIYYYDFENIQTSELHFRQSVNEPDYEQGDDKGVEHVYELANEEPLAKKVGEKLMKE
jgi:hypothetical protein